MFFHMVDFMLNKLLGLVLKFSSSTIHYISMFVHGKPVQSTWGTSTFTVHSSSQRRGLGQVFSVLFRIPRTLTAGAYCHCGGATWDCPVSENSSPGLDARKSTPAL